MKFLGINLIKYVQDYKILMNKIKEQDKNLSKCTSDSHSIDEEIKSSERLSNMSKVLR